MRRCWTWPERRHARGIGSWLRLMCRPSTSRWAEIAPAARIADSWDALLGNEQIDAFVVSRGDNDDARADQLRTLVQTGVPILVAHPVHDSMLVYYELDMNRQETDPVIVPYVPQVWHPAIELLSQWTAEGEPARGHVEQLVSSAAWPIARAATCWRTSSATWNWCQAGRRDDSPGSHGFARRGGRLRQPVGADVGLGQGAGAGRLFRPGVNRARG